MKFKHAYRKPVTITTEEWQEAKRVMDKHSHEDLQRMLFELLADIEIEDFLTEEANKENKDERN
jgi:hypothetical protein